MDASWGRVQDGAGRKFLALLLLALVSALILGVIVAFASPLISVGLLVVALAAVWMLGGLERGLIAFLAVAMLLPFGALPLGVGFNPTLLDGVMVALFLVWLVQLASSKEIRAFATPLTLPLGLFILLAFVAFVAGLGNAGLDRNTMRHFVEVVGSILIFFIVQDAVRDKGTLVMLVRAAMAIGFLAALLGLILYFLPQALTVRLLSALRLLNYPAGWGVLRFIEDDPNLPMRAISTSIDPNVLGGLLILVCALTIPQVFTGRRIIGRFWAGALVLAMAVCLVLTFSRGSMLGLLGAFLFLGVVRYRRLLVMLVAVLIVVMFLPQTQPLILHFWQGFQLQDRATLMRLGEYQDALRLIAQHPWLGVGFIGSPSIELYIGVSNVYLLMAEEMGLVGLGAFLVVMLAFFVYLRSGLSSPEGDSASAILLGLLAALVGALVGGIFDHYFFNLDFPHSVGLFWLYVGLAAAAKRLISQEAGEASLAPVGER